MRLTPLSALVPPAARLKRTLASLCAAIAGAGAAQAASTTQSQTFNFGYTNFDGSASETFPIFPGALTATFDPADPALGSLTSTTVTWNLATTVVATADPSEDGGFSFSVDNGEFFIDSSQYSGTGYGSGSGGAPSSTFFASESDGPITSTFIPAATYYAAILADFTGSSPITLKFDPITVHDDAYYIASGAVNTTASVSLTYDYAPEPESWCLLLIGVGAVGAMVRRGRRTPAAAAET